MDQIDPSPQAYTCPECGQAVEIPAELTTQFVSCPSCSAQFVIPAAGSDATEPDTEEAELQKAEQSREQMLDNLKIQQLSKIRRAAYRSRSYCLIAYVACMVGAVQLILNSIGYVRREHHWGLKPTSYILFALALAMVSTYFFGWAKQFQQEATKELLDEPATPPDFSTLSDGSQHWKNLETMNKPAPTEPADRSGENSQPN